ncbi:hypothetical protein Z945_2062 [Sulfitobacter noctilucae]|uniref:hypothetical protein n=1 Tax=Sulfitobacter noctilucae TaxID=1342302 RepID=UPI000469CAFE|nr:hypothetical protein [Sulfitobacter noctilucae]KIN61077.1 hypothetical protein Z945_2062 [Sulfitobacter noctilucae]
MRSFMICLAFCAGPAFASDLTCAFDKECIEGEDCAETSYTFAVEGMNDKGRAVSGVTDAETMRGNIVETDGMQHIVFAGADALHMLSMSADGIARYAVHMSGPMAITYQGACNESAS